MPSLAALPPEILVPVAVALAVAAGCLILAALSDLRAYLIPNRLSALIALAWLGAALVLGLSGEVPPGALLRDVALAVGIFVALVGLYLFDLLGGGDVKLIPAVALWAGVEGVLPFLMLTALAGGAMSLAVLLARGAARLPRIGGWSVIRITADRRRLPYAVAIAVGGLWVMSRSALG